jgi:hypothetical protein
MIFEALLVAAAVGAAGKAVATRREMKRDQEENQALRDRADAIIAAMDRRSR